MEYLPIMNINQQIRGVTVLGIIIEPYRSPRTVRHTLALRFISYLTTHKHL